MATESENGVSLEDLFGEDVGADVPQTSDQQLTSNELLHDLFGANPVNEDEHQASTSAASRTLGSSSTSYAQLYLPARIQKAAGMRASTVRFPRALTASQSLFDLSTWNEEREAEIKAAEGKGGTSDATIRWRHKTDADGELMHDPSSGRPQLESNTRIVEWEDGSLTLHIGSEVFSLHTVKGSTDPYAAVYTRITSQPPADQNDTEARKETVLEAQEVVTHKLAVRALHTNTSARSIYESRVAKEADIPNANSNADTSKLKVERRNLFFNPEEQRKQRIKEEGEAARRLETQKRKGEEALRAAAMSAIAPGPRGTSASYSQRGDGEDAEESFNIASLKRTAKRGGGGPAGKRRRPNEDAEDDEEEEGDDEEEDEESSAGSSDDSSDSSSSSGEGSDDSSESDSGDSDE